ncbi:helix-turn-helix domain-containing protein [Streptomyces sp. NPDC001107]
MGDHFATAIRQFRLRAGLTQEALTELSGVSVSTIRGLETGRRRNPQLASVRQLAAALDLQPAELDELLAAATGAPESSVVPAPRQLPALPAPFVGRNLELDRLDAALRSGPGEAATVVISAIAGAGGVGKSWLALHWAHRNADQFPDGQLFVDLRGFSPDSDPMDPAVAVRGFLDALGVEPDRIPAAPHAQAALFRSLVADKRMLLVLDNAADTAQITPLLPGGDRCTVVVTSRNRLPGLITGHGAHNLFVDTLTDSEARALLAARLGTAHIDAEAAAVDELVRLCGGFPLALSIIAGRAHTHPQLLLAGLADELRDDALGVLDDTDPAASLPAVLSLSHRALSDEEAEVFGLLAIAPGPDIGLSAAGSLTGLGRSRTRGVLRRLEQASLISQDAAEEGRGHRLGAGHDHGAAGHVRSRRHRPSRGHVGHRRRRSPPRHCALRRTGESPRAELRAGEGSAEPGRFLPRRAGRHADRRQQDQACRWIHSRTRPARREGLPRKGAERPCPRVVHVQLRPLLRLQRPQLHRRRDRHVSVRRIQHPVVGIRIVEEQPDDRHGGQLRKF